MVSETPHSWLKEYLPPGSLYNTNISKKPAQEDNAMNKSVTSLWNMHKSPAVSGTASPAGTATPLEVATPVEEESPIAATSAPEATTPIAESTKSKKRSKSAKESAPAKRPKSKRKGLCVALLS